MDAYLSANRRRFCCTCGKVYCATRLHSCELMRAALTDTLLSVDVATSDAIPLLSAEETVLDPLVALKEFLGLSVNVVDFVPLAAKHTVAAVLSQLLLKMSDSPQNLVNHALVFLFPQYVLARKTNIKVKQCMQIKARARVFLNMPLLEIITAIRLEALGLG